MARQLKHATGGNTFGLSFIDLVSGGFGASFFLFLIFVMLPIDAGGQVSGGSNFLDVWLQWQEEDVELEVVIEYQAKDNGPKSLYRLTGRSFFKNGGTERWSYSSVKNSPFWSSFSAAGFSEFGEKRLSRKSNTRSQNFGNWMRFSNPCPGTYSIKINAHTQELTRLWNNAEPTEVSTVVKVIHANGGSAPSFLETRAVLMVPQIDRPDDRPALMFDGNPKLLFTKDNSKPEAYLHCGPGF